MRYQSIPFTIFLAMMILTLAACAPEQPAETTSQAPVVTSGENAEPGSGGVHGLPIPAAVQAARADLAARLDVEPGRITILEAIETEWSDSCLGLGKAYESCLAAITPGYHVVMSYQGEEYGYRTDLSGESVRGEN